MSSQRHVSQRRQKSSVVSSLPLLSQEGDGSKIRKRRRAIWSQKQMTFVITSLALLVASVIYFRPRQEKQNRRDLHNVSTLPLSKYLELSYALENSDLVALYFAASWCGMSTPISHLLDETFGESDQVLTMEGGSNTLSIVYVSSDKTVGDYNDYIEGRNWIAVPYESPERNQLKEHFKTCSFPEVKELGIKREHEIPTIVVIDASNHEVLTYEGVKDIRELEESALDNWLDLLHKNQAVPKMR